jgi:hypothetical protein
MTTFLLIALGASVVYGQTPAEQVVMEFQGHKVTLMMPSLDANGFAEESAKVCLDATPKLQCYTPPAKDFPIGLSPELTPMDLGRGRSALLFSVLGNWGGPGSVTHLALLRPGSGRDLQSLLPPNIMLSGISEHTFWADPSISDAPILLTADFEWSPDEARFDEHRFLISAYLMRSILPGAADLFTYALEDRYLTVRKYVTPDSTKAAILAAEKSEILARLKRVKAEEERRAKTPR